MLASFHARDIRAGDRISLQTDAFHQGNVTTDPAPDGIFNISFTLACEQPGHEGRHTLSLPTFRLVTVQRNP